MPTQSGRISRRAEPSGGQQRRLSAAGFGVAVGFAVMLFTRRPQRDVGGHKFRAKQYHTEQDESLGSSRQRQRQRQGALTSVNIISPPQQQQLAQARKCARRPRARPARGRLGLFFAPTCWHLSCGGLADGRARRLATCVGPGAATGQRSSVAVTVTVASARRGGKKCRPACQLLGGGRAE